MKKILSPLIFAALFIGFGVMALATFPGFASDDIAAVDNGVDVVAGAAPAAAPSAAINYTNISIPLVVTDTYPTADDVAGYINSTNPPTTTNSIQRVARWDTGSQTFVIRTVGAVFGTANFNVAVGDWLLVGADSTAPAVFTWVGDVPEIGFRSYSLVANGYTGLMLPLDRSDLTTADDLGNDIGDITRVARWDAASQTFVVRTVGAVFGTANFDIEIGYPYLVFSTVSQSWP